jgi:mannitol 2-dehydrogenase
MTHYKLNNSSLNQLTAGFCAYTYNRENVKTGIVHVGVGGFHHRAMYIDQLLHDESNSNWGICGVVIIFRSKIYNTLKDQDGLYTLVVKELDGTLTKE